MRSWKAEFALRNLGPLVDALHYIVKIAAQSIQVQAPRKLKEKLGQILTVRRTAARRAIKAIVICPRCGKKQSVLSSNTHFIILCSRCGSGMREQKVRSRSE